jgi:hypothetical protein
VFLFYLVRSFWFFLSILDVDADVGFYERRSLSTGMGMDLVAAAKSIRGHRNLGKSILAFPHSTLDLAKGVTGRDQELSLAESQSKKWLTEGPGAEPKRLSINTNIPAVSSGKSPVRVAFGSEFTPRAKTVAALFRLLLKQRVVQVRGTPTSGKTVLSELLRVHIEHE